MSIRVALICALFVVAARSVCDPDSVESRSAAIDYIDDSATPTVTGADRSAGDASTALTFTFAAPDTIDECFIDDVEILTKHDFDTVETEITPDTYTKTGFVIEFTFLDSWVDNACVAANEGTSVKYTCPISFHAYYLDDFVMNWSFDLTLLLVNDVILPGLSIQTDTGTIDGDIVELPLEGNFAGSIDGTGENTGPYIVGDSIFPMVSPPADLAGQVDGAFTSVVFVDTDVDSTEYELLSVISNMTQLASGAVIAEVPLLFVTEGLTAEIRLTVEWTLTARRMLDGEAAATSMVNFTIQFEGNNGENTSDDESNDDSSSDGDNMMVYIIGAVAALAVVAAAVLGGRYIKNKKATAATEEHKPTPVATENQDLKGIAIEMQ